MHKHRHDGRRAPMQPLCPPDDGQREQFWDEDVVTATTTGPSLSQSWRAGDVVENVYASGDRYIMNHGFAYGRNVTNDCDDVSFFLSNTQLSKHAVEQMTNMPFKMH